MQNRIDRLESLVLSLMTNGSQSEGPAAAMAAISGTSSSAGSGQHAIDLEVDDDTPIQEESDTEQVTKSFGIMKVDNNKSYYISDAHWASVLSEVSHQAGELYRISKLSNRYQKFAHISTHTRNSMKNR
jgi:hypothetical protein